MVKIFTGNGDEVHTCAYILSFCFIINHFLIKIILGVSFVAEIETKWFSFISFFFPLFTSSLTEVGKTNTHNQLQKPLTVFLFSLLT